MNLAFIPIFLACRFSIFNIYVLIILCQLFALSVRMNPESSSSPSQIPPPLVSDFSSAIKFTIEHVFLFLNYLLFWKFKKLLFLKFSFFNQLVALRSAPVPETPVYSDEAKDDLEVHLVILGCFNQILSLSLLLFNHSISQVMKLKIIKDIKIGPCPENFDIR